MKIGLITSSSYAVPSLCAEFGNLPPSFLPFGNEMLCCHQITLLNRFVDKIYLSLPSCFEYSDFERQDIEIAGAKIIEADAHSSIGSAILTSIGNIEEQISTLVVLYGDTLISNVDHLPGDFCSIHRATDHYDWAPAKRYFPSQSALADLDVVSGMFSFSNVPLLIRLLEKYDCDFLTALHFYLKEMKTTPFFAGFWYDFGHINTYYRSVTSRPNARIFNTVKANSKFVVKTSSDISKIKAEGYWYENIPPQIRLYTPNFLGWTQEDKIQSYKIKNTYLPTLAHLAVFGRLEKSNWDIIFKSCGQFLNDLGKFKPEVDFNNDFSHMYGEKTLNRLATLGRQGFIDPSVEYRVNSYLSPSPLAMAKHSNAMIKMEMKPNSSIIHGDFCFSNIFFDFRSLMIQTIDPRGVTSDGSLSIFGDPKYDIAKLAHSAIYGYDAVISGRISANLQNRELEVDSNFLLTEFWVNMVEAFKNSSLYPEPQCQRAMDAIQVQLFLSMLPLHNDRPDRQLAFLGIASQIYRKLDLG